MSFYYDMSAMCSTAGYNYVKFRPLVLSMLQVAVLRPWRQASNPVLKKLKAKNKMCPKTHSKTELFRADMYYTFSIQQHRVYSSRNISILYNSNLWQSLTPNFSLKFATLLLLQPFECRCVGICASASAGLEKSSQINDDRQRAFFAWPGLLYINHKGPIKAKSSYHNSIDRFVV